MCGGKQVEVSMCALLFLCIMASLENGGGFVLIRTKACRGLPMFKLVPTLGDLKHVYIVYVLGQIGIGTICWLTI